MKSSMIQVIAFNLVFRWETFSAMMSRFADKIWRRLHRAVRCIKSANDWSDSKRHFSSHLNRRQLKCLHAWLVLIYVSNWLMSRFVLFVCLNRRRCDDCLWLSLIREIRIAIFLCFFCSQPTVMQNELIRYSERWFITLSEVELFFICLFIQSSILNQEKRKKERKKEDQWGVSECESALDEK